MKIYLFFIFMLLNTFGLNTIGHRLFQQRWKLWLGYGVPALCMILFMWTASDPLVLFGDFDEGYYPAGRLILERSSSLLYNPVAMEPIPGFVNIPIIAILFIPFSLLTLGNAHFLLIILSTLAVFTICYFLIKLTKVSGHKRIALIGLFVINGPLYYTLRHGNATHFVLLLLVGGLFCIQSKRDIWLGIILAIAALLKLPLFLFSIYYLMRQKWQVVIGFSATLLAIVGASLILFGFDLHLTWFEKCILPYAGKPMAGFNIQSVDGFLARLLTENNLINWVPLEIGWNFKIIRYILLSLLIGGTILVCWRSKPPSTLEEENLEFSIVLCLALVISPITWTYYYSFLLLPLSLYLGNTLAIPKGRLWFNLVLLSTLLISLPVILPWSSILALRQIISKLLISHYFFGGVLLLGVLLAARLRVSKISQQLCFKN